MFQHVGNLAFLFDKGDLDMAKRLIDLAETLGYTETPGPDPLGDDKLHMIVLFPDGEWSKAWHNTDDLENDDPNIVHSNQAYLNSSPYGRFQVIDMRQTFRPSGESK